MHDHKLYIHLTLELFRECDLEFVNVYVNTCRTSLWLTAIVLYFKQFDLTMYASMRCTITESGVEIQTGKLLRIFAVALIVQLLLIQCIIILPCITLYPIQCIVIPTEIYTMFILETHVVRMAIWC